QAIHTTGIRSRGEHTKPRRGASTIRPFSPRLITTPPTAMAAVLPWTTGCGPPPPPSPPPLRSSLVRFSPGNQPLEGRPKSTDSYQTRHSSRPIQELYGKSHYRFRTSYSLFQHRCCE